MSNYDPLVAPIFLNERQRDNIFLNDSKYIKIEVEQDCEADVLNSDGSYSATASCGDRLILPDINFTDSDGVTTSIPACVDIIAKMDIMANFKEIAIPHLSAGVLTSISHNLDASSLIWQIRNDDTEVQFSINKPDPSDNKNKIVLYSEVDYDDLIMTVIGLNQP